MNMVLILFASLLFTHSAFSQSNLVSEVFKIRCRRGRKFVVVILEKNKLGCEVTSNLHGYVP
jgi:hypothetical protein